MLILPFLALAQERKYPLHNKHDLYANVFYATGGYIEGGYEYGFHQKWGAGLTAGFLMNTDTYNHITDIVTSDIKIEPYLRRYFGKNARSGFFIQSSIAWLKDTETYDVTRDSRFGLGFGLGAKYVLPKNWLIEVKLGGGMELGEDRSATNGQNQNYDVFGGMDKLFPNIGLSFGKRF